MTIGPDVSEGRVTLPYSATRPEKRLVLHEDAAAPFFWLTLEVIARERSELGPVERFALRAMQNGFERPTDLADYLGLGRPLLERSLVDLWRADLIDLVPDADVGRVAKLTERGVRAAEDASRLQQVIRRQQVLGPDPSVGSTPRVWDYRVRAPIGTTATPSFRT